jgi:hypothetical protein
MFTLSFFIFISVQQSPSVGGNEKELEHSADTVFPLPSHNCKFVVSLLFSFFPLSLWYKVLIATITEQLNS